MANRWGTQFFGTLEKKPFELAVNFVVEPTNLNGLGVRSVKGPGIANVFMRTSAVFTGTVATGAFTITAIASTANIPLGAQLAGTNIAAGAVVVAILSASSVQMSLAATGSGTGAITYVAAGSPNPAPGFVVVQFQDNWNRYLFGTSQFGSPLTGTGILLTAGTLVVGNPYVITVLGTTTEAQWNAVGLPVGIVPAVGVSFIAKATTGVGTGAVQAPSNSGLSGVEVVGDPNLTLTSKAATVLGLTSGSYMMLQFVGPTSAGVTTLIPKAPPVGTTVYLSFFLSNSTITVQGQ